MKEQTNRDVVNTPSSGIDLMKIGVVRRLLLSHWFPYAIQFLILAFFVGLAVLGWQRMTPEGVPDKLYAKTNIVNLLIWGIWWPSMIWIAILFGRSWCAVCPLELVLNGTERMGRRLGIKQRKLARWLQSGAMIFVLYAMIQLLVAGLHIHRVPAYTSYFLWSLLGGAALSGFFLKDRAFCRGFCPVGLLLGTYGRGSMLAVRALDKTACDRCDDKDCTNAENRSQLDARSCPSLLNPSQLNDNADCLLCGQCIKACPTENIRLWLRRPFHPDDTRKALASWPITLFVMLVSGFVSYELCSEWSAAKHIFLWIPTTVTEGLGLAAYEGWIKAIWMLFVLPASAWFILGMLVVLFRGARRLPEALQRLALPMAVVISAGHMSKGLAKLCSWGGYLPFALNDPIGPSNAQAISSGVVDKPEHLLPIAVVSIVGVVILLGMGYFAFRESRLADATTHRGRIPALALVIVLFATIIFGWGFL